MMDFFHYDPQTVRLIIDLLPEDLQVIQTTQHKANMYKVDKVTSYKGVRRFTNSENEVYLQVASKAKQLLEGKYSIVIRQVNELLASIQPLQQVGEELLTVQDLEKIEITEAQSNISKQSFSIKEGIVTLIYLWNTCWIECFELMEKHHKLFESNPNWNTKVHFVGLSVDKESAEVVRRIQFKKWFHIENYRFLEGWEYHDLPWRAFDMDSFPSIVLPQNLNEHDLLMQLFKQFCRLCIYLQQYRRKRMKYYTKLIYYIINNNINLYAVKYYPDESIFDIPHYVVVDKNGVVRAFGTQDSSEKIVNSLFEEDKPVEQQ